MSSPSASINGITPITNNTIIAINRGDTKLLTATISGLSASGLTGCLLTFTAKQSKNDLDAAAVIQKLNASWTVTQVGNASTPGIATVTIAPADTASLPGYTVLLYWDLHLKDATSAITTLAAGYLRVVADVTITTA